MYPTTTICGSFIQHQRYDMNVNDKIRSTFGGIGEYGFSFLKI
ncbi:MAG: hypothetical protein ACOYEG_09120 [Petrimonas sp.]|jgi:hypothetical protein